MECLTGTTLQTFVSMIDECILDDIKSEKGDVPRGEYARNMIRVLNVFPKIVLFTKKIEIDDGEDYQSAINDFKTNVESFYEYGKNILFNNGDNQGETSYAHVLRFYMPKIAQETFDRHDVPLGVYSMQGYERYRNTIVKNITIIIGISYTY